MFQDYPSTRASSPFANRCPPFYKVSGMNAENDPQALKALQDAIYRDRVMRARAMTPAERLAEVLELSNDIFTWMHAGAMAQGKFTDENAGWEEVSRSLAKLRRMHERGLYKPVTV